MRANRAVLLACLLVVSLGLAQAWAWPWEKKDQEQKEEERAMQKEAEEKQKSLVEGAEGKRASETANVGGAHANDKAPAANGAHDDDDIKTLVLVRQPGELDFGFRVVTVKQSLLVAEVAPSGPAARAGLQFGDQVLTVNNNTPMGRQAQRVHEWMSAQERLEITYRPAPYRRRLVLLAPGEPRVFGFEVDDEAEVDMVYTDSAAVRAGLMTEHVVLSVNGEPTGGVGLAVVDLVTKSGSELVLEVMPSAIYFPIMKAKNSSHDDDDDAATGESQYNSPGQQAAQPYGIVARDPRAQQQQQQEQEERGGGFGDAVSAGIGSAVGSGIGSAVGSGIGSAVGTVLANEYLQSDDSNEEPEEPEQEEEQEEDDPYGGDEYEGDE